VHVELILADRETGQHDKATEKQTNMAKLIGTFHKYANMHKQCVSSDSLQRGKTVSWTDSAQRHRVSRTLTRDDRHW
jgi:hypothetical protein